MSYSSKLESSVRNSVAISVLNSFRHKLQGRIDNIDDKDKALLKEAIQISLSSQTELLKEKILYSFHGIGDYEKSAVIQLSESLKSSIEKNSDKFDVKIFDILSKYIDENNISPENKTLLINLVLKAMDIISSHSAENHKTTFLPTIEFHAR